MSIVCDSEEKETLQFPCNSNNLGYRLECKTCIKSGKVRVYEGETSRSARIRHWYTTSQSINTSYRLVGKGHPHLVSHVEQVVRAGQLHLRKVSRASAFKVYMLRAGQSSLRMSSRQMQWIKITTIL